MFHSGMNRSCSGRRCSYLHLKSTAAAVIKHIQSNILLLELQTKLCTQPLFCSLRRLTGFNCCPGSKPLSSFSLRNPPSSFSFSSRMKLSDGCRKMSSLAVARPTMPPPTTATSYVLKHRRRLRLRTARNTAHMLQRGERGAEICRSEVQRPNVHERMCNCVNSEGGRDNKLNCVCREIHLR